MTAGQRKLLYAAVDAIAGNTPEWYTLPAKTKLLETVLQLRAGYDLETIQSVLEAVRGFSDEQCLVLIGMRSRQAQTAMAS
jgi:hypothetical protein